jgi:hypothetical protein
MFNEARQKCVGLEQVLLFKEDEYKEKQEEIKSL